MNHLTGKLARTLLLSAVMVLLLAGFASAAESQQAVAVGATTGSSLRLRETPSTSAAIVTTLNKGAAVAILADQTDGWYKISHNGKTGYVSADYLIVDQDNIFTTYGRANGDSVNVRSAASTDSVVLASINKGTVVTVNGFVNGWYSVTCQYGTEGYIRSDFLDLTTSSSASSGAGTAAELAVRHLGTRYVYGGASASGFDCSGFTMYIYKQLGYSLPHSATSQWQSGIGTKVSTISALQPGDLVFFNDPSRNAGKACSHAGIYTGGGQFIHASSSKSGVVYSTLLSGYYNQYFVGGIHV